MNKYEMNRYVFELILYKNNTINLYLNNNYNDLYCIFLDNWNDIFNICNARILNIFQINILD